MTSNARIEPLICTHVSLNPSVNNRYSCDVLEVFIAAAHAIQYKGRMLNIDTSKLFSNLPDVLNASLCFWHLTFMPMITEAVQNSRPFNTNLMSFGFSCFKEIFIPYERFVIDQSKLLEYYRKKQQTEAEFAMYLNWCHSQRQCNRLQLNDLLVKPMQRMTKYSLILRRILDYTVNESDRIAVETMENFTKRNVVDLNRSVRQREELDKLDVLETTIENFEVDIKHDEAERICKSFAKLNLRAPMLYCLPLHSRSLVHQGELRFRDGAKEIDVRVLLLTDMLLVCRKLARGNAYQYKQIRPKYMLDKMVQIPKFVSKNNRDLSSLLYVLVDDLGSAYTSFALSEMTKDPNPQLTLKTMENKFKAAKLTYELMTLIAHNPNKELSKADVMNVAEYTNTKSRYATEEGLIEQEALERVATMTHRSMGALTDRDFSHISLKHQSFEGTTYAPSTQIVIGASARMPGRSKKCCIVHRTSNIQQTYTPRDSQSASSQPTPRARSPEPKASSSRLVKRIDTSPSCLQPPDTDVCSSITVRVSESDSEMVMTLQPTPLLQPSPSKSSESSSTTQSTLRVQPQNSIATLIYSLPDLTVEPCTPRTTSSPTQPSASEKMYQSHHEQLQRNRLMTSQTQQYLTPDSRGSSYPPPSPTRASLKRSLAFSYSLKNPPLSKMGHVGSQSQLDTAYYSQSQDERGGSPKPGTSSENSDRKTKLTSSRSNSKKDESEDGHSDLSPTRKDERLDSSYRDESLDLYRRGDSTCSSYKDESFASTYRHGSTDLSFKDKSTSPSHRDESPATSDRDEISAERSYKEISPYSSIQDESPSQSQREESIGRGSLEISTGPGATSKSSDIVAVIKVHGSETNRATPDGQIHDKEQTGRESSDSFLKQESLSFSYDSSRSHKDETTCSHYKQYSLSTGFEEKNLKERRPEACLQEDPIVMTQFPGTSYHFGSTSTDSSSVHSHDKSNASQEGDNSNTCNDKCNS
ncbi:unnamed protein product [Euphydryas editha]|uniref:DH domain-containing protein n=1 Tax=Euphydryas editha TaxID=104508 RepID=A0AAU9UW47_EUPED|nr:unnamed protein product [Euphydryas editha]